MKIGVVKEIKADEYRVALTPAGARELVRRGHEVLVETGAGEGSAFPDGAYEAVGARLGSVDQVWAESELVLKVKEPLPSEYPRLRDDLVLFTYLHLAANRELTEALVASGAACVAYETVETANGALPLLAPMSEIAGRLAAQAGAYFLEKPLGGRGLLLGGVPGVAPGRGARDRRRHRRLQRRRDRDRAGRERDDPRALDRPDAPPRRDPLRPGQPRDVLDAADRGVGAQADVVIGAVLIPGARAPKLITREMIGTMKQGSVFCDVAIDQGGCAETSRPTTHSDPVYVVDGVIHYCVANMPGAVPITSTKALTNATLPYVEAIADHGLAEAVARDPALAGGVNILDGKVTYRAVAEAHGLEYAPLADVLPLAPV